METQLNYLYFRPYGQIRPYGSALWLIKFGLPVFYDSAFLIQPKGPTSLISVSQYGSGSEETSPLDHNRTTKYTKTI